MACSSKIGLKTKKSTSSQILKACFFMPSRWFLFKLHFAPLIQKNEKVIIVSKHTPFPHVVFEISRRVANKTFIQKEKSKFKYSFSFINFQAFPSSLWRDCLAKNPARQSFVLFLITFGFFKLFVPCRQKYLLIHKTHFSIFFVSGWDS